MITSDIIKAVYETDNSLGNASYLDAETSGSTCVFVLIGKDKLICANLGDSCAALVHHDGNTASLEMLNREHKPEEEDERKRVLAAGGRIEPYKGMFHLTKL